MWRAIQILAAVLCLSSGGATATDQILTFNGLGPVRIGMTVAEAEKALGAKFKPMDTEIESKDCWTTSRSDDVDPLVGYMIWNDRIVRIDIDHGEPGKDEFVIPPVATQEGIRIGSTEKEVKQKYGPKLRISSHPYMDDSGHYMELPANNRKHGLLFETTDDRVINFRAGTTRAIKLIEGCQ